MMHLLPMLNRFSSVAADLLLASIWQGVLVTAVVALCLRFARSLTPAARSALWTGVLLLVLCLPGLPLLLPRGPHMVQADAGVVHAERAWGLILLLVWVAASVVRGLWLAVRGLRLWGVARRAMVVEPSSAIQELLRSPRRTVLCTSSEVDRPSVSGFFWPRILLPSALLESLTEPELAQLVLHEMEHLRRRDDWLNLLQQVSLVLLPLSPALVWLDRRLCRERELACDDGVLRATRARKAYAACLVKLAEDSMVRRGVSLALSALGTRARESELVARVRRILAGGDASDRPVHRRLVAAAIGSLGVALAVVLAGASPQLISFDQSALVVAQDAALPPMTGSSHAHEPLAEPTPMPATMRVAMAPVARPVLTSAVLQSDGESGRRAVVSPRLRRKPSRVVKAPLRSAPTVREVSMPYGRTVPFTTERLMLTGVEVPQTLYAAVPWQGGWLIVQL